jgi:RNase adaptor protein for sRNA GlmZ degradation
LIALNRFSISALLRFLTCARGELERRVLTESRKKFGKANNLEILNEILDKYDLFSPVPECESLQIDNTNLSPTQAAQEIVEYFLLE